MAESTRDLTDELPRIIGEREGSNPFDDQEHFYLCPSCGQPVDMRDLAAVLHHEDPGHERLAAIDAVALLPASDMSPDELLYRLEDRLTGGERDYRRRHRRHGHHVASKGPQR